MSDYQFPPRVPGQVPGRPGDGAVDPSRPGAAPRTSAYGTPPGAGPAARSEWAAGPPTGTWRAQTPEAGAAATPVVPPGMFPTPGQLAGPPAAGAATRAPYGGMPARGPASGSAPAQRVAEPQRRAVGTTASEALRGGWSVSDETAPPPRASVNPAARTVRSPATTPQARPAEGVRTRIGVERRTEEDIDVDSLLRILVESGGSDLHLTTGSQPMIRRNGSLQAVNDWPELDADGLRRAIFAILKQRQREQFEEHLELDFSHSVPGLARFRVNLYQQREAVGAAFRVIPFGIKTLEELGVPAVVGNFAGLPRGLVLVTGPTGSGKSTTLAAMIDLANRTRADHIMTVEDPIEFLHEHKKSLVNQREVGSDTHSFAAALKHVLRQDPDIILVGELRDLETISVALTAAETGHLVFATLHTQDAASTVDRIIDVFPPEQQGQVRTQLAASLQGVVCQTLCKRAGRPGRVVATEVMIATPGIRNLVREGKTHQIYSAMQAGQGQGMHTLDQHLADLVRAGTITYEAGLEKSHNVEDFNKLTGRHSRMNQGGAALQSAAANIGGM